jgi:uncharacterized protein YkwD
VVLVNEERVHHHLAQLAQSECLNHIARKTAKDMRRTGVVHDTRHYVRKMARCFPRWA